MSDLQIDSDHLETASCTAFEGVRRIASGDVREVAVEVKKLLARNESAAVLIFDDRTGGIVEVDFRGTEKDVLKRLARGAGTGKKPAPKASAPRGPGRPKLGVVAREVTLLPRHWDWLGRQPGGASVALRRLVENARRNNAGRDRQREARETAYRFMSAMAGNERGFEEATRALFADDREKFEDATASWPEDVRDHVLRLTAAAFGGRASD